MERSANQLTCLCGVPGERCRGRQLGARGALKEDDSVLDWRRGAAGGAGDHSASSHVSLRRHVHLPAGLFSWPPYLTLQGAPGRVMATKALTHLDDRSRASVPTLPAAMLAQETGMFRTLLWGAQRPTPQRCPARSNSVPCLLCVPGPLRPAPSAACPPARSSIPRVRTPPFPPLAFPGVHKACASSRYY